MTTAIYFNEMPTQQNTRGNSKRQDSSGDRDFKNYEAIVTAKFEAKISSLCCCNDREYLSNVF